LTPTQREVASLVVAGRTNREVAATLFMSPHTVEAHLTAIYRVLGIRGRTDLARVFPGGTEAHD
jgi:DNA-binding CsgD family transcriptional regulator